VRLNPIPTIAIAVALASTCAVPCSAQETLDAPAGWIQPHVVDSGASRTVSSGGVVFSEDITIESAAWLRLYFESVELSPGSIVRVTSLLDGEVQMLDAAALERWGNSTAYFNGETVRLELVTAPGALGDRVIVGSIGLDVAGGPAGGSGQCGICGGDDRAPSDEGWIARLLPSGCTASVINSDSCMLSAGHCGNGAEVVQFNVPLSNPDCSMVNPPIDDQFPVTDFSAVNGGPGNDWAVLLTGENGQGQTAYQRFGEHRPVATGVVLAGTPATLTGYGRDLTCELNRTQQFNGGNILAVTAGYYQFSIDLREGNSGSPLLVDGTIVGIATHCPCPNAATRSDNAGLSNALASFCSVLGDANGDGLVDAEDLVVVIIDWGCRNAQGNCVGDVNNDGTVDTQDLVTVTLEWD
jgi:hypothetical protein